MTFTPTSASHKLESEHTTSKPNGLPKHLFQTIALVLIELYHSLPLQAFV